MTRVSITRKINIRAPSSAVPSWITSATLNTWTAMPDSVLLTQMNAQNPGGLGSNVFIASYSGMCVGKLGGELCLLVFGGGHDDYYGNDVWAYSLQSETPEWVRVIAPSVYEYPPGTPVQGAAYYADGKPSSRHTYWHWQWIEPRGKAFSFGATAVSGNGNGRFSAVDAFNPNTGTWDVPGTFTMPVTPEFAQSACVDSAGNFWMQSSGGALYKWTQTTATWASIGNFGVINDKTPMAYDALRNRILRTRSGNITTGALFDGTTGAYTPVTFPSGTYSAKADRSASLEYSPELDRFILSPFSENQTYTIHPTTFAVELLNLAGTPPSISGLQDGLLQHYGRVRYVPELGCLIRLQTPAASVSFARLV